MLVYIEGTSGGLWLVLHDFSILEIQTEHDLHIHPTKPTYEIQGAAEMKYHLFLS